MNSAIVCKAVKFVSAVRCWPQMPNYLTSCIWCGHSAGKLFLLTAQWNGRKGRNGVFCKLKKMLLACYFSTRNILLSVIFLNTITTITPFLVAAQMISFSMNATHESNLMKATALTQFSDSVLVVGTATKMCGDYQKTCSAKSKSQNGDVDCSTAV